MVSPVCDLPQQQHISQTTQLGDNTVSVISFNIIYAADIDIRHKIIEKVSIKSTKCHAMWEGI